MSVTTVQQAAAPIATPFDGQESERSMIPKEAIDLIKTALQKEIQLLVNKPGNMYKTMTQEYSEVFGAIDTLPTVLKRGCSFRIEGQCRRCSPEESMIRLLWGFNRLKTLFGRRVQTDQEFLALKHVSHYLTSTYFKLKALESVTYTTIPVGQIGNYTRFVLCALEDDVWTTDIRYIDSNDPQNHLFELSADRSLLLDEINQPIEHSCIITTFCMDVRKEASENLFLKSLSDSQRVPNSTEFSIAYLFYFYTSLPNKYPAANTIRFIGTLKSNKEYQISSQTPLADASFTIQAKEFASAYIDWKKEDIIEKFRNDAGQMLTYSLCLPNTPYEFKLLERQLLEEIAKNPEEHIETIQWLIDTSHLTLPMDDPENVENEEVLVSAQKGIELLLGAHPMPQKESATPNIDARLVQEDKERKQELEKAAAPTPPKKPNRQKRHQGKTKIKPKEKAAPEKQTKQSLILSANERSQVRHVMQGNSMKGHDFVKFGLTLLERKVKNLNVRRAGSHINAAKQTLLRIHRNGRKDLQGMVSHQKSFLREVLQPSDN